MDRMDSELATWIDAKLDVKFDEFAQIVGRAFQRIEARFDDLSQRMDARFQRLEERIGALEERIGSPSGWTA